MPSFFGELKRRNVFKVGVVYAILAWLLIQIANNFFPPLGLPAWTQTLVAVLILLGLPVALVLAWAYELTPAGVKPTGGAQVADGAGRIGPRFYYTVAGLAVLAVGYYVASSYFAADLGESVAPSLRAEGAVVGVRASPATDAAAPDRPGNRPHSVAVLPFENRSPDPNDAYFAAGIHEQLLTRLGKIAGLTVIARPTVLRYAGANPSIQEIAEDLPNVTAVGGGSVRYADGRVRVTAYLVDTATEAQLWSETYTRPFDDIFAIETEIATHIAAALETELAPGEQRSLAKQATASADAYALYLQAIAGIRYAAGGLGIPLEEVAQFHRLLDHALELDPDFAIGYAAKARDYAYSIGRTMPRAAGLRPEDRATLAVANAERALQLDPDLGLAYAALAVVHRFQWREREARLAFRRALELSPNDFQVLFDAAVFNAYTGNETEALQLANRAADVNPAEGYLPLLVTSMWTGRYQEALKHAQQTTTPLPVAQLQMLGGNPAAALSQLRAAEAAGIPPPSTIASVAYLYHRLGATGDARRVLGTLESFAAEHAVGAGDWALAALSAGDQAEALRWLQVAAARRSSGPDWQSIQLIVTNLYSDPVLEQPEFADVRGRLGWR